MTARVGGPARLELGLLLAILAVGGTLLLVRLDQPYLWQDEAQTALISKTVLADGIPRGSDGRNFFSQELGVEYGEDYVWRWHTWLPFYLVAGSFALWGPTTEAARLPFALLGLATVALAWAAGRALWRDAPAALASAGLLALCVPYLLLCRQARWYAAAACFALLGLLAYQRLRPGAWRPTLGLVAAATLLFHAHYLYCATLLASLLVHAAWLERTRLRPALLAAAGVAALNAPWVAWLASAPYAERYGARLLDLGGSLADAGVLVERALAHFLQPLFLAIPLLLVALRRWRGEPLVEVTRETRSALALLALFALTTVGALAWLAPGPFFRYLAPLAPPLMLVAGLWLGALWRASRWAAGALAAAWLALGSLGDFVHELRHDFDGPIEGIVEFLRAHARPGETVAISYGDMPLKFYTDLRVLGGPTGEDLGELARADWLIVRRHVNQAPAYQRVRAALVAELSPERFDRFELDHPDTPFENREDPERHLYRTARDVPGVQIFRRKR